MRYSDKHQDWYRYHHWHKRECSQLLHQKQEIQTTIYNVQLLPYTMFHFYKYYIDMSVQVRKSGKQTLFC